MRKLALTIAFLVASMTAGMAQESRGTMSGTVQDSSGSVVSGATINLTHVATRVSQDAGTNSAGQYRFLFLNPGRYRLTVSSPGFKAFVRDGIEIHVNQAATIDITLEVGTVSDTVTVTSEAPLLETEKVDRGLIVDQKRVTDLPLNIRNPIMLATLSSGIVHTSGTQHLNPFSNSGISSWSVNGGQATHNEFLMDGAPNNAVYNGANNIAYVPPVDAVEEFKVITGVYDAQYGRTGGGVINVSSKSGTNVFHGSAYEFLKRTRLNANTFSNNAKGQPRQGNALDQYGFSLGGPVRLPRLYNGRDRTFFFFSFENYREDTFYPQESISSVPTREQRRGDFSRTFDNAGRLIQIYDPLTTRLVGSQWVRDAFPGNIILPDRINPAAARIAGLFPEPNTTTPGSVPWQNNFSLSPNIGRFEFQNYTARIDHTFSARQRVYGRWSYNDFTQLRNINGMPGVIGDYRFGGKRNNGVVFDSVTTLDRVTLLNIRLAFTHWDEKLAPYGQEGFEGTRLGWPRGLVDQLPRRNEFPQINIASVRGVGPTQTTYEPTNVLSVQPNVAIIRGRHTVKAGLDYRLTRYTRQRPGAASALLSFDRGWTRRDYLTQDALSGVGFASFLLGYAASGRVDNNVLPYWQWIYYAPWVQDDFKITRKLTLNLGLRWDFNLPPTERFDRMNREFLADRLNPISARIDQTRFPGFQVYGGLGFAGKDGLPRSPYNSDYNNLQPRFGAAYLLTPKTVLRGGWGIFHLNPTSTGTSQGFSQSTPYVASLDSNRTPANILSNPFPSGLLPPLGATRGLETFLGQGISFTNPRARVPYVHQFSFGIQRELPFRMVIDIAYVGSRTVSALISKAINEPGLDVLARGDITQGGDPNFLTGQVPNPFAGLLPGTSLNGPTVSRLQLFRPFPQFSGITALDLNKGRIWYNSLQVYLEKRYSDGLTFLATYTLSKNIEALSYLNAQDERPGKTLTDWDRPHRLVMAPMYELPFGPGRKFLGDTHEIIGHLVGGWQLIVTSVIQSGDPMSIPGNVYLIGDPRLKNPTWGRLFKTGVVDLDGTVRNALPGEPPVFKIRPPFTRRTTPLRYGNLRNRWAQTIDASLIKTTRIRERVGLQFRVEAFNAFNTSVFSSDPNLDPTSPNFGKIFRDSGQNNFPRNVQVGFRLTF